MGEWWHGVGMKCEASIESVAARPVPEVRGYVLEEVIGRGGAGVVWRGVQEGTLREVAVKFLGPWQGVGLAELRFEREAEIAGGLEHENIVRVFDSGESGSGRWLAMELVDGPTVDGWVALEDPPLRRRMEVFAGICAGVRHAHQRGVIHRDLKPGNVLMAIDGTPKVADFGLARRVEGESLEVTLTREGDVFGSLAWMAPEQVAGKWEEVDVLSDVYALGALLYSVVAGRPPVDPGLAPAALAAAIRAGDFPSLRRVRAGTPRDIETMVERCMAVEKGRRYQSAAEVEEEVRRWLRGDPIRARAASPFYWVGKKLRRHWVPAAAVVVVAVAGAGVAWRAWEAERERVAEEKAEADRDAARTAAVLHQAKELVSQILQEMRERSTQANHPEWVTEAEQRVAAFQWDIGGDGSGAYDPRRFGARAAMYDAEAHAARGRWPTALQTYHEALEHLKSLVAEYPGVPAYRDDLARARFGSAKVLVRMRFYNEAMGEALKALTLVMPAEGQGLSPSVVVTVVSAAETMAEAVLSGGLVPDAAIEAVEKVVAAMPPVVREDEADGAAVEWLGRLERVRSRLLTAGGKSEMAVAAARRAVALGRRGMEMSGGGKLQVYRLTQALAAQSVAAASAGDEDQAVTSLEEATRLLEGRAPKVDRNVPMDPYADVAKAWGGRSERLDSWGKLSEAVTAGASAIDWWTRVALDRRDDRAVNSLLSRQQLRQAELLRRAGETAAAKEMAGHAYAGFLRILGSYKGGHSATSLSCAEAAIEVAELEGNTGAEAWVAAADAALKRPRGAKERLMTGQRELLERLEKRLAALGTRVAGQ